MSNKKIGNTWEKECLQILGNNGFFATKLQEKSDGAPFDIVATKDNIFFAIESKEIQNNSKFPISRIEPNQRASYNRLSKVNSNNYFFFFKCPDGNFVLHANDVICSELKNIEVKNGIKLENWLKNMSKIDEI